MGAISRYDTSTKIFATVGVACYCHFTCCSPCHYYPYHSLLQLLLSAVYLPVYPFFIGLVVVIVLVLLLTVSIGIRSLVAGCADVLLLPSSSHSSLKRSVGVWFVRGSAHHGRTIVGVASVFRVAAMANGDADDGDDDW